MTFTFGSWFMKHKARVISIISFVMMLRLGEGRIPRSLLVTSIIFFPSEFVLLVVFSCFMSRNSKESYHYECLVVNDTF
jgi:hypothetical protein